MLDKKSLFLVLCLFLLIKSAESQVKITTGTNRTPADGALLDVDASDKGLMIPRVSLTNASLWTLQGTPSEGMIIYNTNTSTANKLSGEGLYIWSDPYQMWSRMSEAADFTVGSLWKIGLKATTNQTFSNGSTIVTWDTAIEFGDAGTSMYDPTKSRSKVTIPASGRYLIISNMRIIGTNSIAGSNNNDRSYCIRFNGSSTYSAVSRTGSYGCKGISYATTAANTPLGMLNLNLSAVIDCVAGDFLETVVYNSTGADISSDVPLGTIRLQVYQLPSFINATIK